jgi:hypothetical protein
MSAPPVQPPVNPAEQLHDARLWRRQDFFVLWSIQCCNASVLES